MDETDAFRTEAGFRVYELTNVRDIVDFVESLQDSRRFVYRGQANAEWPLETRIERGVPPFYKRVISIRKLECDMLYQFRRRSHHHLDPRDLPAIDNIVEWLAVIQHYGGPTRLLDFTQSPFVAAYFAVNEPTDFECSAIWAVNWQYMLMNLETKLKRNRKDGRDLVDRAMLDHTATAPLVVAAMESPDRNEGAVIVAPFRQNRRLLNQDGVFVAPLNVDCPFEENLKSMFHPHPDFSNVTVMPAASILNPDAHAIIKLIIRKQNAPLLRKRLREMGVRTELLFPDLNGEARALNDIKTRHVFSE